MSNKLEYTPAKTKSGSKGTSESIFAATAKRQNTDDAGSPITTNTKSPAFVRGASVVTDLTPKYKEDGRP